MLIIVVGWEILSGSSALRANADSVVDSRRPNLSKRCSLAIVLRTMLVHCHVCLECFIDVSLTWLRSNASLLSAAPPPESTESEDAVGSSSRAHHDSSSRLESHTHSCDRNNKYLGFEHTFFSHWPIFLLCLPRSRLCVRAVHSTEQRLLCGYWERNTPAMWCMLSFRQIYTISQASGDTKSSWLVAWRRRNTPDPQPLIVFLVERTLLAKGDRRQIAANKNISTEVSNNKLGRAAFHMCTPPRRARANSRVGEISWFLKKRRARSAGGRKVRATRYTYKHTSTPPHICNKQLISFYWIHPAQ